MAKAKQATTIATQVALAVLDLAVEMCTRPWIVELSKKFCIIFDVILLKHKIPGNVFRRTLTQLDWDAQPLHSQYIKQV